MRSLISYAVTQPRRFAGVLLAGMMLASAPLVAQAKAIAEPIRAAFEHMVDGDYAQSFEIVSRLSKAGDMDAQHLLAYHYENGFGTAKNIATAIDLYARAGAKGQIDAQFALGELAFAGGTAKQDYDRALGWYSMAATQGHLRAKVRMGYMYAEGLGVNLNLTKAIELFREAGEAGDGEAQYNIGIAYLTGEGVVQNYQEAADWFEKSSAQGHADSQYNLALIYDSHFLGEPDREKVKTYMHAAADGGMPTAMVAMGLLLREGRIEPGGKTSADWFETAAETGDAQGQFLFAASLAEGQGRVEDPEAALVWAERVLAQNAGGDPVLLEKTEGMQDHLKKAIRKIKRKK